MLLSVARDVEQEERDPTLSSDGLVLLESLPIFCCRTQATGEDQGRACILNSSYRVKCNFAERVTKCFVVRTSSGYDGLYRANQTVVVDEASMPVVEHLE